MIEQTHKSPPTDTWRPNFIKLLNRYETTNGNRLENRPFTVKNEVSANQNNRNRPILIHLITQERPKHSLLYNRRFRVRSENTTNAKESKETPKMERTRTPRLKNGQKTRYTHSPVWSILLRDSLLSNDSSTCEWKTLINDVIPRSPIPHNSTISQQSRWIWALQQPQSSDETFSLNITT